jgi:hypothetical protein
MADVKGDLTGISQAGSMGPKMAAILKERGLELPTPRPAPPRCGTCSASRATRCAPPCRDMGPLLLGRMLNLNETQAGVLNLVFKIADDNGLLLLDLKDLRAMLQYVGDNAKEFTTEYGNISAASVGAIQRGLLQIEQQGGDQFFGEPMLDISDFMQTVDGQGVVNILAADKLMNSPRLYATFLLWMLSELFEMLPEVGDPEKPKLVFFFDEAHLLFNDAPKVLVERIELVVRLVRSKGVGVYFVTQNPLDIPDSVLAQLGNRVQHALRAFTPRDQKAVKATATTMRAKARAGHRHRHHRAGRGRGAGELLDAKGRPSVTERVYVLPPGSQIGPITPEQRQALMARARWWPACTKRWWTANRPTKSSRAAFPSAGSWQESALQRRPAPYLVLGLLRRIHRPAQPQPPAAAVCHRHQARHARWAALCSAPSRWPLGVRRTGVSLWHQFL